MSAIKKIAYRTESGEIIFISSDQVPPPTYDQATGSRTQRDPQQQIYTIPLPNETIACNESVANTQSVGSRTRNNGTLFGTGLNRGPSTANLLINTPPSSASSSSLSSTSQQQQFLQSEQRQNTQFVIVQQPCVLILPFGPEPTYITCPFCNVKKLTNIRYEPNITTHALSTILCVFCLWCFVCLPYCGPSCMTTQHFCGNCNMFLGTYNKNN